MGTLSGLSEGDGNEDCFDSIDGDLLIKILDSSGGDDSVELRNELGPVELVMLEDLLSFIDGVVSNEKLVDVNLI